MASLEEIMLNAKAERESLFQPELRGDNIME